MSTRSTCISIGVCINVMLIVGLTMLTFAYKRLEENYDPFKSGSKKFLLIAGISGCVFFIVVTTLVTCKTCLGLKDGLPYNSQHTRNTMVSSPRRYWGTSHSGTDDLYIPPSSDDPESCKFDSGPCDSGVDGTCTSGTESGFGACDSGVGTCDSGAGTCTSDSGGCDL